MIARLSRAPDHAPRAILHRQASVWCRDCFRISVCPYFSEVNLSHISTRINIYLVQYCFVNSSTYAIYSYCKYTHTIFLARAEKFNRESAHRGLGITGLSDEAPSLTWPLSFLASSLTRTGAKRHAPAAPATWASRAAASLFLTSALLFLPLPLDCPLPLLAGQLLFTVGLHSAFVLAGTPSGTPRGCPSLS